MFKYVLCCALSLVQVYSYKGWRNVPIQERRSVPYVSDNVIPEYEGDSHPAGLTHEDPYQAARAQLLPEIRGRAGTPGAQTKV